MIRKTMKNHISHIVSLAVTTGFLAVMPKITHAQTTDLLLANSIDQSMFPQITVQPLDQAVPLGSNVVLSADANNADACQWLRNGVTLAGQTNRVLNIPNVQIDDVGLYSCEFFNGGTIGGTMVPTRAASVQVETWGTTSTSSTTTTSSTSTTSTTSTTANTVVADGNASITVLGTPVLGSGSQGSCPGSYIGYVHYSKSISDGWGWSPKSGATTLTAADGSGRTDTKILYFGLYGDMGCAQTMVTIPYPPLSPAYQFWIYFTNNVPDSKNYPIILTGFNQ